MWNELWNEHRSSIVGISIGLLLGFIYLFSGFWNMLVFEFIVFVAYSIGKNYALIDGVLLEMVKRLMERFRS